MHSTLQRLINDSEEKQVIYHGLLCDPQSSPWKKYCAMGAFKQGFGLTDPLPRVQLGDTFFFGHFHSKDSLAAKRDFIWLNFSR